ncbi:MAG: hypothetical protein KKB51_19950 [Candidatus Riflebacteria bacterium]|nr:hypothetical protein [Candidatus Riflebacteria bacterium]
MGIASSNPERVKAAQADIDELKLSKETMAWARDRNKSQKGVEWRFSTKDARIKLKSLYSKLNCD